MWGRASILVFLAACGGGQEQTAVVVPTQPIDPKPIPPPSPTNAVPVPVATVVAFKCEGPAKRFDVGLRAYCGYESPASWEDAESQCVKNGGHLMTLDSSIRSEGLHTALGSPIGAGRAAWIGLERKTKGKPDWKWSSGETPKETNWNSGEPNDFDGNEMCGEWLVADGSWNDTRCDLKQPYLCEGKADTCKEGRTFMVGGTSYCLHASNRTFAEAKKSCATNGATLAMPKTTAAGAALRDAIAAKLAASKMWIGYNDNASEGEWVWSSGSKASFTAWKPGEPNDFDTENCAELWADTWKWNDFDCNARLPFVCESPK